MNEQQRHDLDEHGYLLLRDFMTSSLLSAVRWRVDELFEMEGETAGSEFKIEPQTRRLANLADKGEVFLQIIQTPEILECMKHVLGPEFKLSSLNARSANPNSNWVQPLHMDGGELPDEKGFFVCNSIWLLDDFTLVNGAIRIVPGSHRWRQKPQDILSDLAAAHPDEVLITGSSGTVVVMNSHLWHGATANRTGKPRRALHAYYTRRDKPQQLYQKQYLRQELQSQLSPQLRKILALDDPLNDEICSRVSKLSGFLK